MSLGFCLPILMDWIFNEPGWGMEVCMASQVTKPGGGCTWAWGAVPREGLWFQCQGLLPMTQKERCDATFHK